MSQVIVSRNTIAYRQRHRIPKTYSVKSFLILLTVGIFISFLSVMMLVNFNKVSTKGYTIKYLEVQQQKLWEENELLKKDLLEQKALTQLSATEKAQNMVRPGELHYVSGYSALANKTD